MACPDVTPHLNVLGTILTNGGFSSLWMELKLMPKRVASPFFAQSDAPEMARPNLEPGVEPPGYVEPAKLSLHQFPNSHQNYVLRPLRHDFPPVIMEGKALSREGKRVRVEDPSGISRTVNSRRCDSQMTQGGRESDSTHLKKTDRQLRKHMPHVLTLLWRKLLQFQTHRWRTLCQ